MARLPSKGWAILAVNSLELGRPILAVSRRKPKDAVTVRWLPDGSSVTSPTPAPLCRKLKDAIVVPEKADADLYLRDAVVRKPQTTYMVMPVSEAEVALSRGRVATADPTTDQTLLF